MTVSTITSRSRVAGAPAGRRVDISHHEISCRRRTVKTRGSRARTSADMIVGLVTFPSPDTDFRGTDRFQVRRRIGQGGMGSVYEAWDRQRGVAVALKTLHED